MYLEVAINGPISEIFPVHKLFRTRGTFRDDQRVCRDTPGTVQQNTIREKSVTFV